LLTIVLGFLTLVPLAGVALFFAFAEYLDWHGRMEVLEKKHPRIWRLVNDRSFRLVLLFMIFAILSADLKETLKQLEPGEAPVVRFVAPSVPAVEPVGITPPEPTDSLRRRTVKLADALYDYMETRRKNHPPYAYPQPNDPNPPEDQKNKIKVCGEYDDATHSYYSKHFRDQIVGIIREYNAKGVKTAWLENTATQGNLSIAQEGSPWEGSRQDDLSQFRDLAYHVDARDRLITF
jgi:hypothetical protein